MEKEESKKGPEVSDGVSKMASDVYMLRIEASHKRLSVPIFLGVAVYLVKQAHAVDSRLA